MAGRILLVEDERSLRAALRDKLAHTGYEVIEAADGEEGLARALADRPDLIVLDIAMPRMSGEEMLEKLRADEWGKSVPVIVLTNVSFLQDEKSKARTDEYLLKADTDLADLVEKVREHLKDS